MITVQDLINDIELYSEFVVVIYDYETSRRYQLDPYHNVVRDLNVKCMYVEDGILFIELDCFQYVVYCEENCLSKKAIYLCEI